MLEVANFGTKKIDREKPHFYRGFLLILTVLWW
jgi:hypothetical protein